PRPVVGRLLSRRRHLPCRARLQPLGRRVARRARPQAAMTADAALLEVADLRVAFRTPHGTVAAVRGIDFSVGREKLGIVGESGSGKPCTGRAVLRLLPERAVVTARRLAFAGTDLLAADEAAMREIRGRRISMIMQDPKFSLNPVIPVGKQIAEAYLAHFP